MNTLIEKFLKRTGLTENQFLGIDEYKGYLDLRSATSIPEGFSPTVGGYLYLSSATSIPEGFSPTVGGYLYLSSATSIPEGFRKSDFENQNISFMKWGKGNGKYILCDNRFSEVISKKGNIWKLKDVNKNNEYYLLTDNHGKYAHGNSIKEAKADLMYKISNRDKSQYVNLNISEKISFEKAIEIYRVITGACSTGVRNFIEGKNIKPKKLSIQEIAEITLGNYGNQDFCNFFKVGHDRRN